MFRRIFYLWIACVAGAYVWTELSGSELSLTAPEAGSLSSEAALGAERSAFAAVRGQNAFAPPTAEERRVKAELEAQLRGEASGERIAMRDGRVFEGQILEKYPDTVRILRSFGDSGEMEMSLPRAQIASIERNRALPPTVSIRDVRFRLEFPDFNLYRRPPFTIVTDQSFLDVEDAVRTLQGLHGDVLDELGPLLEKGERSDGIQILFFSDEAKFAAYRDSYAPGLGYASGFYSVIKDRLVIFDQGRSEWVEKASRQIDRELDRYAAPVRRSGAQLALHRWHTGARRRLQGAAARANRSIIRHEGAHQMLSRYGVHSAHGAEHLWLIEGLASYFEPLAGAENEGRAAELRDALQGSRTLQFGKLINHGRGFAELGSEQVVGTAYAQSWMVIDYLMREQPAALQSYIRFVRDPAHRAELEAEPRFDILSRHCGRSPEAFEAELQRRARTL